jgi:DNA-binding SARP family transcriptional activator
MTSRARNLLTGVCALSVLAALMAGLPVVLYRFGGSPLPQHVYSWPEISAVLASRDDGTIALGVIRDVSWLAWLVFTIAVAAEVQAVLRGRSAPRLGLGGVQSGAARLVALAALAFSAPSAVTLTFAGPASAAAIAPAHPGGPRADANQAPVALAVAAEAAPVVRATRHVIVESGDCLWTLAQRYLGAGDLYPEIANMNYGQEMGDGQVFTNPALIQPGWRLLMPASARMGGQDRRDSALVRPLHHPGHGTQDPHYRHRHATAGQSEKAGPDAARPGAGESGGGREHGGPRDEVMAEQSPAGTDIAEAAVFAAGAIAGAVLTSLTRLRGRQRQYRRHGRRIALPADPGVGAAERRLQAAASAGSAGPSHAASLQDALRLLEAGLLDAGHVVPDIVGVHVTPQVLEVLLAAPAADGPPPPFAISPGRQAMCWQLDLPAQVGQGDFPPDGSGAGLLPGLFTVGCTDDGYLLLDLESLQVTGCDGVPVLIDQVVTAVATELATRRWSAWYDLVLVGFDQLEVVGRGEHYASLDDALDRLEARVQAVLARGEGQPPADIRQLRLTAPADEDWSLSVLVSRTEPSPEQLERLLDLAEDGPGGVAAFVAGDPETPDGRMAPAALQLAPAPDALGGIVASIVPLQIVVYPQALTAADYEAIGTLFATAAELDDVSPEQAPYDLYAAPPWIPEAARLDGEQLAVDEPEVDGVDWLAVEEDAAAWPAADESGWPRASEPERSAAALPVSVGILGPLLIVGSAELLQPQQGELMVALALAAPGSLSNSALCSLLGPDPDHPKPSEAVRQIITRTRRRLGRAADGREYIIHAGNGTYLLHPDASFDWTRFRELTASGRADHIRSALGLVRGEPFTGSYFWWIDIPLLETVRAEIVDAAHSLAEFELAAGSPRAAARAALAGLSAEVSAEQLWRLLMRAEYAAGNPAGVAEAWRHCLDAIEDVAPGGEPHPETASLYRQLTGQDRQHLRVRG